MATRSPTFDLKPLPPKPEKEKFTFNQLPKDFKPSRLALDEQTQEYFLVAEHTTGCRCMDHDHHPQRRQKLYIGPVNNFAEVEVTKVNTYRGSGVSYEYIRADAPGKLHFPERHDVGNHPTNSYNGKRAKLTDLSDRL